MANVFQTISRVVYGPGSVDQIPFEVKRFGDPRVFIITDKGLVASNMHKPVEDAIAKAGIPVKVWGNVVLDPTPESVEECVAEIKDFNASILIGLGGGPGEEDDHQKGRLHGGRIFMSLAAGKRRLSCPQSALRYSDEAGCMFWLGSGTQGSRKSSAHNKRLADSCKRRVGETARGRLSGYAFSNCSGKLF